MLDPFSLFPWPTMIYTYPFLGSLGQTVIWTVPSFITSPTPRPRQAMLNGSSASKGERKATDIVWIAEAVAFDSAFILAFEDVAASQNWVGSVWPEVSITYPGPLGTVLMVL
jgi:hypothetical protein